MKSYAFYFLRLVKRYGWFDGLRLAVNLKLNKSSVKVPKIPQPIFLRKETSDFLVFNQFFLDTHEELAFIKDPKVIIDGGAYIGLFSVLVKNKFPQTKIICVEPDEENYKVLQKNIAPYENIYCENAALWPRETRLIIHDKYKKGKWAMVVEEDEKQGKVQALSINQLMQKYNIEKIDVLKLDIEGSEKELFSENYESWLPQTKMIIIELHDFMRRECARQFFETINRTFQSYSYLNPKGENTAIINNDLERV